jgi:1-acyl-sn-glycerol-3-phosphate acyltransferase
MMMPLDAITTTHKAPSTTARKPWALRMARRYVRRQSAGAFDGVYMRGIHDTRALMAKGPVLFVVNHVSYWDAFALVLADEALDADSVALMDEKNLGRLPFFSALGALPLSTSGGPQVRRQLAAAAAHLSGPQRALWLFPQGRQRAWHLRPLAFQPGLRLLSRHKAANGPVVVPVSLAYPWRDGPGPALVMHLHADAAIDGAAPDVVGSAEAACAAGLDAIDDAVDRIGAGDVSARAELGDVIVKSRVVSDDVGASLGARALRRIMGGRA